MGYCSAIGDKNHSITVKPNDFTLAPMLTPSGGSYHYTSLTAKLFTQPHIVPNLIVDFSSSVEHKIKYFEECS